MKKVILAIIVIVIFANCKIENKVITRAFSNHEVFQISQIVSLMDSIVIKETGASDLDKAYVSFYQNVVGIDTGTRRILANSAILNLVSKIDTMEVFNQIWIRNDYRNTKSGSVGEYLFFNKEGKYISFLRRLCRGSDFCKQYYKEIKDFNEVSIIALAWFYQNHLRIDIDNYDYHVLFVVHLISSIYDRELVENSFGKSRLNDTIQ